MPCLRMDFSELCPATVRLPEKFQLLSAIMKPLYLRCPARFHARISPAAFIQYICFFDGCIIAYRLFEYKPLKFLSHDYLILPYFSILFGLNGVKKITYVQIVGRDLPPVKFARQLRRRDRLRPVQEPRHGRQFSGQLPGGVALPQGPQIQVSVPLGEPSSVPRHQQGHMVEFRRGEPQ